MTADIGYTRRRDRLATYFDDTASEAWTRLTSEAPVSGIRATVRQGRDRMRAQILSWLPADLTGCRLLDAGCGTGALAIAAAERGAQVVAVDIAASLVAVARERTPRHLADRITYAIGDMEMDPREPSGLAARGDTFDHTIAMDSLIHYAPSEMAYLLGGLARRTRASVLFTYAPATPALRAMHVVGRLFPRNDRAPEILPVSATRLVRQLESEQRLSAWRPHRTARIAAGFYTSQVMELVRV